MRIRSRSGDPVPSDRCERPLPAPNGNAASAEHDSRAFARIRVDQKPSFRPLRRSNVLNVRSRENQTSASVGSGPREPQSATAAMSLRFSFISATATPWTQFLACLRCGLYAYDSRCGCSGRAPRRIDRSGRSWSAFRGGRQARRGRTRRSNCDRSHDLALVDGRILDKQNTVVWSVLTRNDRFTTGRPP
jgi:hypothetical protein